MCICLFVLSLYSTFCILYYSFYYRFLPCHYIQHTFLWLRAYLRLFHSYLPTYTFYTVHSFSSHIHWYLITIFTKSSPSPHSHYPPFITHFSFFTTSSCWIRYLLTDHCILLLVSITSSYYYYFVSLLFFGRTVVVPQCLPWFTGSDEYVWTTRRLFCGERCWHKNSFLPAFLSSLTLFLFFFTRFIPLHFCGGGFAPCAHLPTARTACPPHSVHYSYYNTLPSAFYAPAHSPTH